MNLGYLYQISTQHTLALAKLVTKHFTGFTYLIGEGYWKGQVEETGLILVSSDFPIPERIEALAKDILETFNQEAILLTISKVDRVILTRAGAKPTIALRETDIPVIPIGMGQGVIGKVKSEE